MNRIDPDGRKPIISLDYTSLEEFKNVVKLIFDTDKKTGENKSVTLEYTVNDKKYSHKFKRGYTQEQIQELKDLSTSAKFLDKVGIGFSHIDVVYNQDALKGLQILGTDKTSKGQQKQNLWNISVGMYKQIISPVEKNRQPDKGLKNSILHIITSSILGMYYGKGKSNFALDVHERRTDNNNINQVDVLIGGKVNTKLEIENALDNYSDLVNNMLGIELGLKLKNKYNNAIKKGWSLNDSARYLNDIQNYFSLTHGYKFKELNENDEIVRIFTILMAELKYGENKAEQLKKIFDENKSVDPNMNPNKIIKLNLKR